VIAGLAGLAGLILGRLWDIRSEATRWRRDQRIRSYEQLAGAYYAVREGCRDLAMLEPESDAARAAAARVLDMGIDWNKTVVAVWLHSSPRVAAALRELDYQVDDLFLLARSRRFTWDEWRKERQPAEKQLEILVETIRRELSLPRLTVSIRTGNLSGLPRDTGVAIQPRSDSSVAPMSDGSGIPGPAAPTREPE
jgi:hypothetical protein